MHIAILTGGNNAEREVALKSSENVRGALDGKVELSLFDFPSQIDDFLAVRDKIDCCVPVFHGKGGEDGVVQGFLETLGMPYIFSDVRAHAVGMDKMLTKMKIEKAGFLTPGWLLVQPGDEVTFSGTVVVKPNDGGSTIGISIARNQEELEFAVKEADGYCSMVLVEKYIQGREFTVSVIDQDDEVQALPVVEIISKHELFDYESKYDPKLAEEICPAQITSSLTQRLQVMATDAHRLIGARHLSRSDMIVDDKGDIYFLEINTIPGLTNASLVPKALDAAELELGELLMKWINESI
ncbi:MAG: D-alanine--D-alanine ligase [Parcubacteria group bacterium]|nr:D-alanine--D-alanine ligase [Parcubacteria group bacterium]